MNAHNNDFNYSFADDRPTISEPIPDGTVVFVQMTYTPGGAGPGGAFTKSQPSADNPNPDTEYLKAEFTVLRGPYKGRKFWSNMTLKGGKLDEKGNSIATGISRGHIRLILDSARGLSSRDESLETNAKRQVKGFPDLQGLRFICKVKVEPARKGYPAKNGLGQVLTLDMKDYPKNEADLDNPKVGVARHAPVEAPAPQWAQAAPAQPVQQQPAQQIVMPNEATSGASPFPPTQAPNPPPTQAPIPAAHVNGDRPLWMQ